MTIGFILNGEDMVIRCEADVRLVDILRGNFGLFGAKPGCLTGKCGGCTVIFNGKASQSCLIPAFRVRGSEIITIEGFAQTDEYHDIIAGFTRARLDNCGYCSTGKILVSEVLLERNTRLSREEILAAFGGIKCRCTDSERLVTAVEYAVQERQRRLYGRST
jgi:carbon-monoxide dehydrogenase small subunit